MDRQELREFVDERLSEWAERRRSVVTRTRIENAEYPCLHIHWLEDEDKMGWEGQCTLWINEGEEVKEQKYRRQPS